MAGGIILKSDSILWLLCLQVFLSVAILTLRWPSILDCYFSGQLRADYIRGQVYHRQVLVKLES
jgi:hypothetical protein